MRIKHSSGGFEANKALSFASCFISLEATCLVLYFLYSTCDNALTLTYFAVLPFQDDIPSDSVVKVQVYMYIHAHVHTRLKIEDLLIDYIYLFTEWMVTKATGCKAHGQKIFSEY